MVTIDLAGKAALVTGGAAGIGKACAQILSQAGAKVAVVDIDLDGAKETAAGLTEAKAFHCNLGDPESISGACAEIS